MAKRALLGIIAAASALSSCGPERQEPTMSFYTAACQEAGFSRDNPGVAMVMDTDNRRPAAFVPCYGGQFDENAVLVDPNVRNVPFDKVVERMGYTI